MSYDIPHNKVGKTKGGPWALVMRVRPLSGFLFVFHSQMKIWLEPTVTGG